MVQRTPIRASTSRALRIGVFVMGAVAAIIAVAATQHWGGLIAAPIAWFILLYSLTVYVPEPALDDWDKIPRDVRLQMVRIGHPAAFTLAQYDRDPEIKRLWWKTLRVGKRDGRE